MSSLEKEEAAKPLRGTRTRKRTIETTPLSLSKRMGKDEMNLVEHPFAFLKRPKPGDEILLEWERVHPSTGKRVQAMWRVSGDAKLGMPGPVEERLYLVLMELSREQGWPQTVNFSRGDVLRRLGLTITKGNYGTLNESFKKLAGVRIEAQNSFWNATSKNLSLTALFAMIDDVRINPEAPGVRTGQIPLALSTFKWSDVMHEQHVAGHVRSLHIAFALSLDLPLSTRLFRYLDKHKYAGEKGDHSKFEIELHLLCEIHLGMTSSRYVSKLKDRLSAAHEELTARGFLAAIDYEPMKSSAGKEKVVYYFAPPGSLVMDRALMQQLAAQETATRELGTKDSDGVGQSRVGDSFSPKIEAETLKGVRANALRCHSVFESLDGVEKERLLTIARAAVEPIWWDRVGVPESPMSLGLWELVMEHHPEKFLD